MNGNVFTLPERVITLVDQVDGVFNQISFPENISMRFPAASKIWDLLSKVKVEIHDSLLELAYQLEWNHLMVAFYGETNAGKSTLIEALRILLNDDSTKSRRNAFLRGENIEKNVDGRSIGDGRSDFTRVSRAYSFLIDDYQIKIFDVPGIEGAESLVSGEILAALSKSHLVFYVSSRPTPPQSGADDGRIGTLEKIGGHLRDEAEVWLIYNKRVTSPRPLLLDQLVTDEDAQALKEAKRYFTLVLGQHFKGELTVAAMPAFLAVAGCLVPDSDFARKREKLLSVLPVDQILQNSGLQTFYSFLTRDILPEMERKKTRINMMKLGHHIAGCTQHIRKKLIEEVLLDNIDTFCMGGKEASKELDNQIYTLPKIFERARVRICRDFFANIKMKMEKKHADGLWWKSDAGVQDVLKEVIEEEKKTLEGTISNVVKEISLDIQKEIQTIITRLGNQFAGSSQENSFVSASDWSGDFMKEFTINTNSGVSFIGLAMSIPSLFFGPLGWFAAAAGTTAALWDAFNPQYQEAENRKAIASVIEKIELELNSNIDRLFSDIRVKLVELISNVKKGVDECVEDALLARRDCSAIEAGLERLTKPLLST